MDDTYTSANVPEYLSRRTQAVHKSLKSSIHIKHSQELKQNMKDHYIMSHTKMAMKRTNIKTTRIIVYLNLSLKA